MKKWLSILGIISLTVSGTSSIIACNKHNNSENKDNNKNENGGNRPQQPPVESNWKLVIDYENEFKTANNKWYIFVPTPTFYIYKGFNDGIQIKHNGSSFSVNGEIFGGSYVSVYRWDGNGEPQKPEINKDTGKILDWKG